MKMSKTLNKNTPAADTPNIPPFYDLINPQTAVRAFCFITIFKAVFCKPCRLLTLHCKGLSWHIDCNIAEYESKKKGKVRYANIAKYPVIGLLIRIFLMGKIISKKFFTLYTDEQGSAECVL